MSHKTSAEVVADSISSYDDGRGPATTRLTSMYVVFPKMVMGERNRHRAFSLSDRSSRAVPPEKLIQEVRDDPATPALFRKRTKGMGGGEILSDLEWARAEGTWQLGAREAAAQAEALLGLDLAKEIVNRPLDPFIRMHSLMTATQAGWMNFFGLRLDAGADPTIQVLAQKCWAAYTASTPRLLRPGEWHLPFVDWSEDFPYRGSSFQTSDPEGSDLRRLETERLEIAKKLSAARCAHLSYNDLETGSRMTIDRALLIYSKLVESRPLHASPMEHQATPDVFARHPDLHWLYPEEHGNLYGWRQARKMLPGEAVAPLPEEYA